MQLELSEHHRAFRDTVRAFARGEIQPRSAEMDAAAQHPFDLFERMGEMGLLGLTVPEEYGGRGEDTLAYSIAVEEVSYASGSVGISLAAHNSLGCSPIVRYGTEVQKRRYLPDLAAGRILGAFALTERHAGSDAGAIHTRAVRDGDGWLLNGRKVYCSSGGIAGVISVAALTDPEAGKRGITSFLVERGAPGFRVGDEEDKFGVRASVTSRLSFEDVRLPQAQLLGTENEGFKQFLTILDGGRISIGAMAVGIAQAAYDAALAYSHQRRQFGAPINRLQAIQHKLADMACWIEASRLLVYEAAFMKDRGRPYAKHAAMAKLYASELGERACNEAIQIFGGNGYIRDYPVERFYRDQRITEIGEGTSEIQKLVIGRELVREYTALAEAREPAPVG